MLRRTSLSLLILLALALGACSSDSTEPDRPVDPSLLRLQIVSGDRQSAPVAPASGVAASPLPRDLSAAELPANLLPQPLVARIVVDDAQAARSVSGASLATLPSGVVVTYRVVQPSGAGDRHCGSSFIDAAVPDAEGYVTTYWELGTYAEQPCRMETRLVVDGEPRVDTVFTAQFQPGPVARFRGPPENHPPIIISPGDTVDGVQAILGGVDAHGNLIDPATIRATVPDSLVRWRWCGYGMAGISGCYNSPSASEIQTGWMIPTPAVWTGEYDIGLRVWLYRTESDGFATFRKPAS